MMETRRLRLSRADGVPTKIVGPTCYEGDVFAAKALAPRAAAGEVLVFAHCGAYASSLASSLHGLDPIPEYVFE